MMGISDNGGHGLLPAQMIKTLMAAGGVTAGEAFTGDQVQPASLDLRLGDYAWRIRASFLPGAGACVADKLEQFALHRIDLRGGAVLETGCVYIAQIAEALALPEDISAAANPKSSTGRLDVFTRIIADRAPGFDLVAKGYKGPLYAEICPQTFPILVRPGVRLAQLRFRRGAAAIADDALLALDREQRLVTGAAANIAGGIALSADLTCGGGIVGYRAKRHTGLIDLDRVAAYPVADYWEPIAGGPDKQLILDPDQFYILASKEAVHVPPAYAAEMIPFNPLVGEFRVHYAGFFDPGFGHAASGGTGSRAVLEVRSHKVPFLLEDGQIVGRLIYEKLIEPPEALYGAGLGSHYQAQGLKLSKHFR